MFGGGHDDGFAHKAAGKRHTRNGEGADRPQDHGDRHGLIEAPKLGAFTFSGAIQHGTGGHPKQRLVDDVAECVRDDSCDGEVGADAHSTNHESNLIDDAVGENTPHVIFKQGVNDAVKCHNTAYRYENLPARKAADQCVYGGLGGVGTQDDSAHDGRFRIGVRQPTRERHGCGID